MLRHLLLALLFLPPAVAGDNSSWRETIKDGVKRPLETLPVVTVAKSGDEAIVFVKNPSSASMTYAGYSRNSPQVYKEKRRNGRWVVGGWLVSSARVELYTLNPGQTVDFRLHTSSESPDRIYTVFSSPGGERSSLILLYGTE